MVSDAPYPTRRQWRQRLALVLALLAVPYPTRSAYADEPSSHDPSTGVEDGALTRARVLVAEAESLFRAGHYAAALAEYTRAYDMLEGHPRQYWVLHNLAACNERLFRYDVALNLYEEYLRRAPQTEEDRAAVAATIGTLRSLLSTLVVESSTPAEVWVDDRKLGTAPGRWMVPAGRHAVELRAPYYEAERREMKLDPGRETSAEFTLRRLSRYQGPSPGYFWAAAGLSGAAATAGTVFGVMALQAHDDGREQAALYLDTSEEAESAERWALASDACFGGAAVFAVTATILYFVTDWSAHQPTGARRRPLASSRPAVSVGFLGGLNAAVHAEF